MEIKCNNYSKKGDSFSDFYDPYTSFTSNGKVLFTNSEGQPVDPKRAVTSGFTWSPDFKFPEFRSRASVTDFLTEIGIPRGSVYSKLYSDLAKNIPETPLTKYKKPEHS